MAGPTSSPPTGIDAGATSSSWPRPWFDDPAITTALAAGRSHVGRSQPQTHAIAGASESGTSEAVLARIHAPVGLDLGGHTPPSIALGILAEIVSERQAGTSGRLTLRARLVSLLKHALY